MKHPTGRSNAGRAVLALVVAVGREVDELVRVARVLEDVGDGAVDRRVAAPAPLVRQAARVADAGQDQAVLDPRRLLAFACSHAIAPIVPGTKTNR